MGRYVLEVESGLQRLVSPFYWRSRLSLARRIPGNVAWAASPISFVGLHPRNRQHGRCKKLAVPARAFDFDEIARPKVFQPGFIEHPQVHRVDELFGQTTKDVIDVRLPLFR